MAEFETLARDLSAALRPPWWRWRQRRVWRRDSSSAAILARLVELMQVLADEYSVDQDGAQAAVRAALDLPLWKDATDMVLPLGASGFAVTGPAERRLGTIYPLDGSSPVFLPPEDMPGVSDAVTNVVRYGCATPDECPVHRGAR